MVSLQEKSLAILTRLVVGWFLGRGRLTPRVIPKVQCDKWSISTPVGEARVLVYRSMQLSSQLLPVYVNLHGGGFILGNAQMDDVWCRVIADRADCVVVNVDYRLAPENKYPIALEETYGVVKWVYQNPQQLGIDPERIALGGHSAGGNLTAAVCLLARESKEFPILTQILDYPPLDLATEPEKKPRYPQSIPPRVGKIFNTCYLPSREYASNPLVSPVFAESLAGLPPALVITAEYDSLAREAELYAQRLQEAGVKVTYKQYPGASHAFTHNGNLEMAEDAWNLMISHLRQAFGN